MILFFLSLINLAFSLPPQYSRNSYTEEKVEELDDTYFYRYKFLGHDGKMKTWSWQWNRTEAQNWANEFGVDPFVVQKKKLSDHEYQKVMDELINGGFRQTDSGFEIDMAKLVLRYRETVKPLYRIWKNESAGLRGRDRVEVLMRFFQDIPYGIPPDTHNGLFIGGMFSPVDMFQQKYGDCDSKSLVFAAILSLDSEFKDRLVFISVPGHILVGIQDIPRPYDNFVRHQGVKYVMVEPVGLGRTPFGKGNESYRRIVNVQQVVIGTSNYPSSEVAEEYESEEPDEGTGSTEGECPDGAFLVDYTSQFSGDRTVSCKKNVGGKYINHGPETVYDSSGNVKSQKTFKMGIEL